MSSHLVKDGSANLPRFPIVKESRSWLSTQTVPLNASSSQEEYLALLVPNCYWFAFLQYFATSQWCHPMRFTVTDSFVAFSFNIQNSQSSFLMNPLWLVHSTIYKSIGLIQSAAIYKGSMCRALCDMWRPSLCSPRQQFVSAHEPHSLRWMRTMSHVSSFLLLLFFNISFLGDM